MHRLVKTGFILQFGRLDKGVLNQLQIQAIFTGMSFPENVT